MGVVGGGVAREVGTRYLYKRHRTPQLDLARFVYSVLFQLKDLTACFIV